MTLRRDTYFFNCGWCEMDTIFSDCDLCEFNLMLVVGPQFCHPCHSKQIIQRWYIPPREICLIETWYFFDQTCKVAFLQFDWLQLRGTIDYKEYLAIVPKIFLLFNLFG